MNETAESAMAEGPLIAGKGFLYRAEYEPAQKRENIVKAQDKFTELLEYKSQPLLAAKSAYFVGICHLLLENEEGLQTPYFARAALGIMAAIEQCERARYSFHPATFFVDFERAYRKQVAQKHNISYGRQLCESLQNGYVDYPRKDEFMLSVQSTVGIVIPVCCIDFVDDLCNVHHLPEDYVAAHGRWRRFSDQSEYVKRRDDVSRQLSRIAGLK